MYGAPPPGGYGAPPPYGYGPPPGPPAPAPGWGPPPPPPYPQQSMGPFPPHLELAPQDRRIDETFGFFPAAVVLAAAFGIVGAIIDAILGGGFDSLDQLRTLGIAAVVAVVFSAWEIYRRTHSTSLIVTADQIGIYRKGALQAVVSHGQLTWYRLNVVNSLREFMIFGMAGLGGLGGAAASGASGEIGTTLLCAGIGIGGSLALASSIWSRWMCLHYYVPKGGGTETVVLRKSVLKRLGCWAFPV